MNGILRQIGTLICVCVFCVCCSFKPSYGNETKTVLIAVDLSESTQTHRNDYIRYFRLILDAMCEGDVLMVTQITIHPSSQQSLAFNVVQYEKASIFQNRKKVQEANFMRSLNALHAFQELMKSNANQTPIIEVTRNCERLFAQFKTDRHLLVYFSDMLEWSPYSFNFESLKPIFNMRAAQQAFQKTKSEGRIANLKGVKVYVAGARCIDPERYQAVKWFWTEYFAAAKAIFDPINYGTDLIVFNECNPGATCNTYFKDEFDKKLSIPENR